MENPSLLQPFVDYLCFEKRYSPHTVKAYHADLIDFFDFISITFGETELSQISHALVRSWLAGLKDSGLSAASINRKISTLKAFFKFQIRAGLIRQSPMARVVAPKKEKRLPAFVAGKDMATLFQHVTFPDTWKGQTDRLLLLLFYQTGMRLSEAIGLKDSSFNFSARTVKVLGKGNKERLLPLSPALKAACEDYLQKKRTALQAPGEAFLVTAGGKPLSPRSVYTSVREYLNLVTTIEKRSPHVLRHTFATHLTNNGADINAVKELLGHSSLAATQVYTHTTIERLKTVYQNAHPREQKS